MGRVLVVGDSQPAGRAEIEGFVVKFLNHVLVFLPKLGHVDPSGFMEIGVQAMVKVVLVVEHFPLFVNVQYLPEDKAILLRLRRSLFDHLDQRRLILLCDDELILPTNI
jgi:hypothetical protein